MRADSFTNEEQQILVWAKSHGYILQCVSDSYRGLRYQICKEGEFVVGVTSGHQFKRKPEILGEGETLQIAYEDYWNRIRQTVMPIEAEEKK